MGHSDLAALSSDTTGRIIAVSLRTPLVRPWASSAYDANRAVIDLRRPNFDASPASAEAPPIDLDALGFTLLLSPGAELEPTAVEQLAWYLLTHPDAAAATCFHITRAPHRGIDDAGCYDWAAVLSGRSTPHVALVRSELLAGFPASSPRDTLLACAERGLSCGTVRDFLCWGPCTSPPGSTTGCPRLSSRQFPPPPREHALSFEPVPEPPAGLRMPADLRPREKTILFVVPWFTLGGADKFNLRLGEQLRSRGWRLSFAATNRGDQSWLADFAALTPDIHILPHFIRPDAAPLYLRYLIATRRPEVVFSSNSELFYLSLPYLRLHAPGPVYVDYTHMEEPRWKNGGWCRYGAGWQDLLELNIVTSNHLKRWMVSRGADADRVEVATINEDPAKWGSPPDARVAFRARHGIAADAGVILYAARICEQKKPHVFIRTVHALRDRGINFVALVAGDGPDHAYLEKYADGHNLRGVVRFLRAVPPSDMPAIYAASDAFFLPSAREGIALVMFEAMASGLPVVGAAVGGQPDLVTPECGVLIRPAADEEEVAIYADTLAALLADPGRRAAMGAAGRDRISKHFSLDSMGDRMVALFARARELADAKPRQTLTPRLAHELAALGAEYLRVENQPPPPSLLPPLRYRIADRLNSTLSRIGISAPLKRLLTRNTGAAR